MRRAIVAVALTIACGAIEAPVISTATSNSCSTDSECGVTFGTSTSKLCPLSQPDCVKLKCTSGACVLAPASAAYSLTIQVPTSNYRDEGMTLALSPKAIATLQKKAPVSCLGSCLPIPIRGGARGTLTVDDANAKLLWPGGLQGTEPATSVPATIELEPLWSDGVSPQARATWRGVLLPKLEGTPIAITPQPGASGPLGQEAVGYQVFFQSTPDDKDGLSAYEVTFHPLPPYDAAFPPLTVTQALVSSTPTINDLLKLGFTKFPYPKDLDTTAVLPFKQLPGAPSTAGSHAYVVALPGGERISNLVTLSGDPNETHQLFVAHNPAPEHTQLVVDPPDGVIGRPSVIIENAGGSLVFAQPTFPKLPPPVVVSGTVTAFDANGQLAPVPADVVFDSQKDSVLADDPTQPYNLNYRAFVRTTAVGTYQVTLPPGQYDVWITPHETTDPNAVPLARTYKTLAVAGAQSGKSFIVSPRVHLRGRVVVGASQPLVGAEVVAQPSADRFAQSVANDKTELTWPREARAVTDADGRYDLTVDPWDAPSSVAASPKFDIAVRPSEGSRLPWFVLTNTVVANADVALADIQLPAPMAVSLQLVDDFNNPVPRAVVSALLRPPQSGPDPVAARVVGRTMTDERGRFQLFLPPYL